VPATGTTLAITSDERHLMTDPTNTPYDSAPPASPHGSAPGAPASTKKTMAILSVVFGAVSLALTWIIAPFIFLVLAIAGAVLGFVSRSREPGARTLALVGIILSLLAAVASVVSMILAAVILSQLI
jgi:CHASE2 domain-containing sensor protein